MHTLRPFLALDCSCDEALRWSNQSLTRGGLRVMQTFNLIAARQASQDFECPQHGRGACDCQMVVLMVYGIAREPATLIWYGQDGQTWFTFADLPSLRVEPETQSRIEHVLRTSLLG